MSLTKKQAQETSYAKWSILKSDFNRLFEKVHDHCGFCTYSVERRQTHKKFKCYICKTEFPKIHNVCAKMLDFFNDTHNEVETMINEIIDAIRTQNIEEKKDE